MTREEAVEIIKREIEPVSDVFPEVREALDIAVKALEQEPCDDAISRQAAFDTCLNIFFNGYKEKDLLHDIKKLPSVNPQEPCEDTISRRDMALNIVSFYNKAIGKKKTLDFLCKCVESLPSVQPMQRWIPVSERLPEKGDYENGDYVLCCDKYGYMAIGRMSNWSSYWCFDGDIIDDVIAWMPLPEPYKAESEVKNDYYME